MTLNVIHLPHRSDRWQLLLHQFQEQNITDYKIWNGVIDSDSTIRAISNAHKQIVRYAKERKLTEILIAEDDLCFTSNNSFQFFLENKPSDYDIYLSSIYHGLIRNDNTVEDFAGLTLYIVHQKFYNTFLAASENINIDRALRNKGKYIVCNPFTVIQHNGFSDNIKQHYNYSDYMQYKKQYGK